MLSKEGILRREKKFTIATGVDTNDIDHINENNVHE